MRDKCGNHLWRGRLFVGDANPSFFRANEGSTLKFRIPCSNSLILIFAIPADYYLIIDY